MRALVSLCCLVFVCLFVSPAFSTESGRVAPPSSVPVEDWNLWYDFQSFIAKYKRVYRSSRHELERFEAFKGSMATAARLNEFHNGTAEFGVTQFADMTDEEFAKFLGGRPAIPSDFDGLVVINYTDIRDPLLRADPAIDWNQRGMVTPVRQQGTCGSCWSFAGMAELESRLLKYKNIRASISTQQNVDCDMGSNGCEGGYQTSAWKYIFKNGGVMTEANYRYAGVRGSCRYRVDATNFKLPNNNIYYTGDDPNQICDFMFNYGPVDAAIDATPLKTYRNGVLNYPTYMCPSINHFVLLTGYDKTAAVPFFRVKNSWGLEFGEQGYLRIAFRSCMINAQVYGSSMGFA